MTDLEVKYNQVKLGQRQAEIAEEQAETARKQADIAEYAAKERERAARAGEELNIHKLYSDMFQEALKQYNGNWRKALQAVAATAGAAALNGLEQNMRHEAAESGAYSDIGFINKVIADEAQQSLEQHVEKSENQAPNDELPEWKLHVFEKDWRSVYDIIDKAAKNPQYYQGPEWKDPEWVAKWAGVWHDMPTNSNTSKLEQISL